MEKTTNTTTMKENTKAMAKKALSKRAEIVACPKGLKINLQEESKAELKDMASNGFVIIFEVAERQLALSKSIKVLSESVAKLNAKILDGETLKPEELERLKSDTKTMSDYQEKYAIYRNIKKEALKSLYAPLVKVYKGYEEDCASRNSNYTAMNKAFVEFFAQYEIEYKGALKAWFMNLATVTETGAKHVLNGQLFKAMKQDKFCEKMLKGIIDIAIAKKAVTFTAVDKSVVKFFEDYADIDSTIKTVEEEPTTVDGYVQLFDEVGIYCADCKKKEDYEKLFKKHANRLFIFKA